MNNTQNLILFQQNKSCCWRQFSSFLTVAALLYILIRLALLFAIRKFIQNILHSLPEIKQVQIKLKSIVQHKLTEKMLRKLQKVNEQQTKEQSQKIWKHSLCEEEQDINKQLDSIEHQMKKITEIFTLKQNPAKSKLQKYQTLSQRHLEMNCCLLRTLDWLSINLKMQENNCGIVTCSRILFFLFILRKSKIILKSKIQQYSLIPVSRELSGKFKKSFNFLKELLSMRNPEQQKKQKINQAFRQIRECQIIRQIQTQKSTSLKTIQQFLINQGNNKCQQFVSKSVGNDKSENQCQFDKEKFKTQLNSLLLRGLQRKQAQRKMEEEEEQILRQDSESSNQIISAQKQELSI